MSMNSPLNIPHGVLTIDYAKKRQTNRALRYRLERRTDEVLRNIQKFYPIPRTILDLGAAEGRMTYRLSQEFPSATVCGVEYNPDLVAYGKQLFPTLSMVRGDVSKLDILSNIPEKCDVMVATAIIEHLPSPNQFLQHCRHRLTEAGIMIITCPDPAWECIATFVGHLKGEDHHDVPSLKKLRSMFQENGFEILDAYKFMFSPIGFPFEIQMEKLIRILKSEFLLANQCVIVRKKQR